MKLSDPEIGVRARTIWASNGNPPGTELADWLGDWRSARAELQRSGALARQLEEGGATEFSHLFRAILNASPAAIFVKDTWGRYLLVNGKFKALYKVSQDWPASTTDDDLFPPGQAAARRAKDLEVITSGQPLEFEETITDVEDAGEDRTYLSLLFPITGPDREPYAVCGISTDVTQQKRCQRSLVIQHAVTQALARSATSAWGGPDILEAVCQALGWDVGLNWQVDPDANRLRCTEVWHAAGRPAAAIERMSRGTTFSPGVGLPGLVWSTGRPVWIENVVVAANFPRAAAALEDGLHGACGFPVRNGGEVLGVIEFFSREVRRPDRDLTLVMGDIGGQVSQFFERQQAQQALLEREREFSLARAIQVGLLPKGAPTLAGFVIAGASHPAQETGGDYFDYIPAPDGSLGVAIGDASGHGIGAALVIAETRAYLRARAATDTDLGRILTLVNRHVAADVPEGNFVTLFLARLDAPTRTLTYTSAGHGPGYVLDDRGEVREVLGSTNIPVGLDPAIDYLVAPAVVLRPGEIVLLLTDGIQEASSPDGQRFGLDRVLATVRASRDDTPDGILKALFAAVRKFSPGPQADDMTAVIVKVDNS
jgi:PAS domain S-box-containing protein